MKISLCMIVKDEEEVLGRCLESVKEFADQIVIADTGSVDNTIEIARRYTDEIYEFPWIDNFAAARNFSFSKGAYDYLMWMDADDVLTNVSKPELIDFLERENPDMVRCPYRTVQTTFFRERLLKKSAQFQWCGRVHECIAPSGKVLDYPLEVCHLGSKKERGMRNLRIYQKWAGEEPLSARDLFYYGRELYYHKLYPEAQAILNEALSRDGWYVNQIDACRTLGLCHEARGEQKEALEAYWKSFFYGEPRAFVLCEIGKIFRSQNRFREAIYWYQAALQAKDHSKEGDFEDPACFSLVPLLGLVCCHYALGERETAKKYHKKTEELFPEHPSVNYNRQFFQSE